MAEWMFFAIKHSLKLFLLRSMLITYLFQFLFHMNLFD